MKTTAEILKLLNLEKNAGNNSIAKNYLNFLKLINEVQKDIVTAETLDFKSRYSGEYDKQIKITTSFGSYKFIVPSNTDFYSYLCVILKIQSNYIKPIENLKVENTIYVDFKISDSIVKALKFTDIKAFLELSKNIYLSFKNDVCEVYSTNSRLLYKSQKFNFISDSKIDNLVLAVPTDFVSNFKTTKNEFLQIDLIDSENILVNGLKVELSKIDSSKIFNFDFEVQQKMEFSKVDFLKSVKSLKGFLDHKKSIEFHLNGSIQMQPQNYLNKSNTVLKMDYLSKDFDDLDLVFGFDNLVKVFTSFKSKNILLSPKTSNNILVTDSIDNFIIVNQLKK